MKKVLFVLVSTLSLTSCDKMSPGFPILMDAPITDLNGNWVITQATDTYGGVVTHCTNAPVAISQTPTSFTMTARAFTCGASSATSWQSITLQVKGETLYLNGNRVGTKTQQMLNFSMASGFGGFWNLSITSTGGALRYSESSPGQPTISGVFIRG